MHNHFFDIVITFFEWFRWDSNPHRQLEGLLSLPSWTTEPLSRTRESYVFLPRILHQPRKMSACGSGSGGICTRNLLIANQSLFCWSYAPTMVDLMEIEPTTFSVRRRCASRLRHKPICKFANVIALNGFEPLSKEPESLMIDLYTTGLYFSQGDHSISVLWSPISHWRQSPRQELNLLLSLYRRGHCRYTTRSLPRAKTSSSPQRIALEGFEPSSSDSKSKMIDQLHYRAMRKSSLRRSEMAVAPP